MDQSKSVKDEETRKEPVNMKDPDSDPGPIGIEIGAIATLIATGYSGRVQRTYNILDKDVVVTFKIPK